MELHSATGRLTAYGLSCGYVEQHEAENIRTTLWKEHGTYHVRAHSENLGRLFWESFRTLGEATKRYNLAIHHRPYCNGKHSTRYVGDVRLCNRENLS
jgi:hypothetical protein